MLSKKNSETGSVPPVSNQNQQCPPSETTMVVRSPSSQHEFVQLLSDIQQKINNSPALNGGFDTLVYKVDKIEQSQGKIVTTLDSIHDAIYAPDDGLFSRVAAVKTNSIEDRSKLEQDITELSIWKQQTETILSSKAEGDKELYKRFEAQQKIIEDIHRWKSVVSSVLKWAIVALAGGSITLMFKLLYDFVVAHWK